MKYWGLSSVVREINKINEKELQLGLSGASWHDDYKGKHLCSGSGVYTYLTRSITDSAYIYVGGLHLDMTEGDVITIFSQYVPHKSFIKTLSFIYFIIDMGK